MPKRPYSLSEDIQMAMWLPLNQMIREMDDDAVSFIVNGMAAQGVDKESLRWVRDVVEPIIDEELNRVLGGEFLEKLGARVLDAVKKAEAVRKESNE